jgi:hypothetical protein
MSPCTDHLFAIATREEVWVLEPHRRRHVESRISAGSSLYHNRNAFPAIEAGDVAEGAQAGLPALRARADHLMAAAAATAQSIRTEQRLRVRAICSARHVQSEGRTDLRDSVSTAVTAAHGGNLVSVVSTPHSIRHDISLLSTPAGGGNPDERYRPSTIPILWAGGTAAVLFHEAVGHPAEHGHRPIQWPKWLRVIDDPGHEGFGAMRLDDTGAEVTTTDLTRAEASLPRRRESFRDAPLPRMSNLVVAQENAPFEVPDEYIEVGLLTGGRYEPLTENVSLVVAMAHHVCSARRRRVLPFEIRASREAIAAALLGARGEPIRYPGVVCSTEGQEILVGSFAPLILTRSLADG